MIINNIFIIQKCLQDLCGNQEDTNCSICKKVINYSKVEEIEYISEIIPHHYPINILKKKKWNIFLSIYQKLLIKM
jgi:hypothetical protein